MKTYKVWITNKLSSSTQPSPNRIQATSPAAAERTFWNKIKPKDRSNIVIVKVEEVAA